VQLNVVENLHRAGNRVVSRLTARSITGRSTGGN
jgi:hypothetical protein